MNWNSYFEYKTGKLYWKVTRGKSRAGNEAGYITTNGYMIIGLACKNYLAHRIVWEMHNGPIPEGMEIDHINHNRIDNRIENLRIVTKQCNLRNQSIRVNNTSGVTGVSWDKSVGKWHSQIKVASKSISLGVFVDFNDAVAARKEAERKYGFHENHGK